MYADVMSYVSCKFKQNRKERGLTTIVLIFSSEAFCFNAKVSRMPVTLISINLYNDQHKICFNQGLL